MKKIEMIDIKVEAKINITFGTIDGETFKFFFTIVDKKIAERFIRPRHSLRIRDILSAWGLDMLAQIEMLGPVCPQCEQRLSGLDCSCGYSIKSEVLSNLTEAANDNKG